MTKSIFVNNLPDGYGSLSLYTLVANYGKVESAQRARARDGNLLPYGYVKMLRREDAQRAITELNGLRLSANSEPLFVTEFIPSAKRYTKLYIANISPTLSSETLRSLFSAFGQVILVDWQPGNPFGFIHFRYSADGQAALEQLNNAILDGRPLQVRKAHSKREIECRVAEQVEEVDDQEDQEEDQEDIFPEAGKDIKESEVNIVSTVDDQEDQEEDQEDIFPEAGKDIKESEVNIVSTVDDQEDQEEGEGDQKDIFPEAGKDIMEPEVDIVSLSTMVEWAYAVGV